MAHLDTLDVPRRCMEHAIMREAHREQLEKAVASRGDVGESEMAPPALRRGLARESKHRFEIISFGEKR